MDTYVTQDGRVWRQIDAVLHTRKDGLETVVIVWVSQCVVCGGDIEARTPINLLGTQAFKRRHCEQHKVLGGRWKGICNR